MPLCPQITNTPITVVLNADFTVTNVIPVLPATNTQVNTALADAQAAQTAAAAALVQAGIAFTAAQNSLQPSANTIVNASNQMTAINGTGITVFSGASATSGARVVLNSVGLAGFNAAGTATFSVSASTGAAVFSGSVTGATITASTMNIGGNAIIDASGFLTATGANIIGTITATSGSFTGEITATSGTISGALTVTGSLTGGTIQTSSGSSAVIINGASNAIQFKTSGSVVANMVPLSSFGLLMHFGSTPDPSGGTFPQIFIGSTGFSLSSQSGGPSITATTAAGVNFFGTTSANNAFFVKDSSISAATPNARIDTDGRVRRTTGSSIKFKNNIVDLVTVQEMLPSKLLALPVRAFKFKPDYLDPSDNRVDALVPGFIAEEVAEFYPAAADYGVDGNAENWSERFIIPGMLALVQDLYKEIAILKGE